MLGVMLSIITLVASVAVAGAGRGRQQADDHPQRAGMWQRMGQGGRDATGTAHAHTDTTVRRLVCWCVGGGTLVVWFVGPLVVPCGRRCVT